MAFCFIDKEFVRFENGGDSSTNCVSVVRVGSAGRVERNLQMARKKELEDEIFTDSASSSGITAYGNTVIDLMKQLIKK